MKSLDEFLQFNEARPKTTRKNPVVTIYDKPNRGGEDLTGLSGHMHLSTAANIYGFEITNTLIKQLWNKGEDGRVAVSHPADKENPEQWPETTIYLALSPFSAAEIKKGKELSSKEIQDLNVARELVKMYSEYAEKIASGEIIVEAGNIEPGSTNPATGVVYDYLVQAEEFLDRARDAGRKGFGKRAKRFDKEIKGVQSALDDLLMEVEMLEYEDV